MTERMGANGQPMKKKPEPLQEILEVNPNEDMSSDWVEESNLDDEEEYNEKI